MWVYHQSTGELYKEDLLIGKGYSGHGEGLNNPKMEMVHSIGPIPKGLWEIGIWFNDAHLGPCVAALRPVGDQELFGRGGFFVHGDNKRMNHTASDGCIILSRSLREEIKNSKETFLTVEI